MKGCKSCMLEYPDDKKFCKNCGSLLIDVSPQEIFNSEHINDKNKSDLSFYLNKKNLTKVACILIIISLLISNEKFFWYVHWIKLWKIWIHNPEFIIEFISFVLPSICSIFILINEFRKKSNIRFTKIFVIINCLVLLIDFIFFFRYKFYMRLDNLGLGYFLTIFSLIYLFTTLFKTKEPKASLIK
jgi:hypothetical protein